MTETEAPNDVIRLDAVASGIIFDIKEKGCYDANDLKSEVKL